MKELWNKFVAWLKKLLSKTELDNKVLESMLDKGIDVFMTRWGDKGHTASITFIGKVEASIKSAIRNSDTKIDDIFLPFIEDFFATLTTKVVDKFLVPHDIELTLKNFKSFILGKYSEWEKK